MRRGLVAFGLSLCLLIMFSGDKYFTHGLAYFLGADLVMFALSYMAVSLIWRPGWKR